MHPSQPNGSSEFIRHEPCPDCESSDGLAVYTDGHTFCFVCHTWNPGNGSATSNNYHNHMSYKGFASRLSKRNLSEATCEKYKIYQDGDILRMYYHDDYGKPVGAKVRTKSKIFTYEGESNGKFFGQHLSFKSGKVATVVITEGELDAASVYQANGNYPVVSLPSGAAGAKRAIKQNFEWLQQFDKIILWFDNDEPGKRAAKEAADVLPPGKAFIATTDSYKDASDALQANDYKAIEDAFWNAKPYRPDGIVEGKTLMDLVTTPNPPNDHDYPFQGLQHKLHGIRYGELVTITAGSGIGKSSFCRELATSLLQTGERVGYLALEESNRRSALGLMSSALGQSFHLGEHERSALSEAYQETLAKWNLFLFDGFGSYDPDVIYNRIEYLATGLDCRIIFLDHLSILLSGLDGDERRMIDQTMTKLRSLVERTGIALFLVSHLRRSGGDKNHEEGARVTLGQLRGSASIAQLSDSVIGLERDQQSEQTGGATTVRVLKNRYSGETGVACTLEYDLDTCKFIEHEPEKEFDPTTEF
jgi:twinkle protein